MTKPQTNKTINGHAYIYRDCVEREIWTWVKVAECSECDVVCCGLDDGEQHTQDLTEE